MAGPSDLIRRLSRKSHRVVSGSSAPDPAVQRRLLADRAHDEERWSDAGPLWEAIFEDAREEQIRRFAGRRAALSYRRAGQREDLRRMLRALLDAFPPDDWTRRELARFERTATTTGGPGDYWIRRSRMMYIQVTREISRRIASHAGSVVDVGSHDTPILDWFPDAPVRVSVDLRRPYRGDGIESVTADFMSWRPGRKFDVGLCLQVLEHVPDAASFAAALLDLCDVVIVSVPYRWPEETTSFHVHDPVDEAKLSGWFGRRPNYSYIVSELDGQQRIICVYDTRSDETWHTVKEDDFRFRWNRSEIDGLLTADMEGTGDDRH